MLIGAGAEAFADTRADIERVPNAYFDTPHRRRELDQAQARERADADGAEDLKGTYFGTIGAVALDAEGRIATATSPGGMTNKRRGRVGDTPLVGAGTWVDQRCGVSGTRCGDFFIRFAVAPDIAPRVEYRGDTPSPGPDPH